MASVTLPGSIEQVSGAEMLACVLFRMIDEGDDECLLGDDGPVASVSDVALMLCDLTRANRLGVSPSPATMNALVVAQASLAVYRAANRGN